MFCRHHMQAATFPESIHVFSSHVMICLCDVANSTVRAADIQACGRRDPEAAGIEQVMTELTDAVQGAKGKTVLYTPQDDLDDVQEVARDQVRHQDSCHLIGSALHAPMTQSPSTPFSACLALPCIALPCLGMPCSVLFCHVLYCHAPSDRAASRLIWPCVVLHGQARAAPHHACMTGMPAGAREAAGDTHDPLDAAGEGGGAPAPRGLG